ncbi:MAG: hypothetical protein D3915_03105 [Candidatus Electrothrix sp. AU1_5]|nr:hypothetical protein [Candidatus Electrothrix gigas]
MKTNEPRKIFAVPYNGTSEIVKRVIDAGLDEHTYEFYGTDNAFASGRSNTQTGYPTPTDFESDVKMMVGKDMKFNYLLNSLNASHYFGNLDFIKDKLKYLSDIGVDVLTITHPFLARMIKSNEFSFDIRTSLNNYVNSVDQAKMFLDLGYNSLIISEDELRNLSLMRKIIEECAVPIEVIINNNCVRKCINRFAHQSMVGDPNVEAERLRKFQKMMFAQCYGTFHKNFNEFMKSSWIRPEDIPRYLDIGVTIFKLSGRTFPTDDIMRCLTIYASRSYSGNVLDYMIKKPFLTKNTLLKKLEAKYVEPYFEHIWGNECQGDACPECQAIADRIAEHINE